MKKIYFMAVTAVIALMLGSCASPQNVAYIQNSESIDMSRSAFLYDAKIMPKDVLTITVSTVNPEASAPFNLVVRPTLTSVSSNIATSGGSLQTYLVDNAGTIEFPVVGTLQVGGLSKAECEKLIHDKVQRYMNADEDPVVTVRMSNYKISVMGEVGRPGMFTVGNEKINIFEALAQAGDLTIYGDRVKLIREDAKGKKSIVTLNLNDANIINSPYYYLQQNDIIYVEPNKVKAQNSNVGAMTTLMLSGTGVVISLASLIVNILR